MRACKIFITFVFLVFQYSILYCSQYKVSICVPIGNDSYCIKDFLEDIVKQTVFEQCELVLCFKKERAPGEQLLSNYFSSYPNITSRSFEYDYFYPKVLNAILAETSAPYAMIVHPEDALAYDCCEVQIKNLEEHLEVDFVYHNIYCTELQNLSFDIAQEQGAKKWIFPEFAKEESL